MSSPNLAPTRIERPKLLADLAADQIRNAIIDGRFAFGQQVSEVSLAASLGTSKTPVREALLRLALEGLVEIHPQRGSFIVNLSAREVAELTRFRALIESAAIGEAIALDREAMVDRLQVNVASLHAAQAVRDVARVRALDTEFHEAIVECSGNAYLARSYALIAFKVRALRARLPEQTKPVDDCHASHGLILQAVVEGDVATAQRLLAEHIRSTEQSYLGALRVVSAAA
jgi:DNA-binding GntR family transcriptional regulator